jgi:hypothetical protein
MPDRHPALVTLIHEASLPNQQSIYSLRCMEHATIFGANYGNYLMHWIDEITPEAIAAMG